jgi:hypothetical protein
MNTAIQEEITLLSIVKTLKFSTCSHCKRSRQVYSESKDGNFCRDCHHILIKQNYAVVAVQDEKIIIEPPKVIESKPKKAEKKVKATIIKPIKPKEKKPKRDAISKMQYPLEKRTKIEQAILAILKDSCYDNKQIFEKIDKSLSNSKQRISYLLTKMREKGMIIGVKASAYTDFYTYTIPENKEQLVTKNNCKFSHDLLDVLGDRYITVVQLSREMGRLPSTVTSWLENLVNENKVVVEWNKSSTSNRVYKFCRKPTTTVTQLVG